ncbi:vitelline membrane outer layer protein 1 homolog [Mixophyes fleayi]|uniref:vitelline membrane outer layer protein 1 homolog n=1 Tax=Mixophyes fleayi TaxID=3061075 RepID=UPI003F4E0569
MAHITSALVLLSLFSVGFGKLAYNYITTDNGGKWGTWGKVEMCPPGYKAKGVSLKVEPYQGEDDDTALNGVRLHCFHKNNYTATVQSSTGSWGDWGPIILCSHGYIEAYQLKVEPYRGNGDDTAANNIKIQCSNGQTLEAAGGPWGTYGSWSNACEYEVCGIRTKVEPYQGEGDDTAFNDLRMYCCDV